MPHLLLKCIVNLFFIRCKEKVVSATEKPILLDCSSKIQGEASMTHVPLVDSASYDMFG